MIDFVGKIWYNARREGFYSLAPFRIFPDVRITKFWNFRDQTIVRFSVLKNSKICGDFSPTH